MVLISEIPIDGSKEPAGGGEVKDESSGEKPPHLADDGPAVPLVDDPAGASLPPASPAAAAAKTPLYNEYALRVAYVMRLYMRHGAAAAAGVAPSGDVDAGDRCKAMVEIVRKDNSRWSVSKVVLEHSHLLSPPPDPAGDLASGALVPTVGMEFDSISIAKAFYDTYCEKMGFRAKTGSGRRSRGSRMLIMQRFFCSKGNTLSYPSYPNGVAEEAARKRKRGPYKKKGSKNDGEVVEVIPVESGGDKGGVAGDDQNGEVQSGKEVVPGKEDGEGKGKAPVGGNPAQSRLLRELGIRVSKYTNEERRDIILKYMKKRSNRQVVDRSIKVPSRQALAERRQRGFGGKFLSKEETQTLNKQEETPEEEPEVPAEVVASAGGAPVVGMVFDNEDKAYEYYVNYAGNIGFSVRKGWWDKSARNVTRSRVYVCSREGFRPRNGAGEAKKPRPETRTGCSARMAIKITNAGRYRVTEFVPDHNHQLAAPLDIQLLKSQKLLAKAQPGGCQNANLIPSSYKNYLRAKRMKGMQAGDAGGLFEYLQKMKGDNPSFYYAVQVDEDDQVSNVFWADSKSMMDYCYFGDVVCFDTSYEANEYGRPFAQFIGLNHHKQIVIFGAAFLYDETVQSFKWLFESFKAAMCGKQPKTILIGQSAAISDAIAAVWPGTVQRLCGWQLHQNAVKHLSHVFQSSETFAQDFSQCVYDFEEEDEFVAAWATMLEKYNLSDNEWLAKIFEEREKWALAYGRQTFCGDLQSTLRGESLTVVIKESLNPEIDLHSFLKQYERLVDEQRYAELQADYHANQGTPRIHPLRLLWQAANVYTPEVFKMFRREFELYMDCMVYSCGEVGTLSQYEVTNKEKPKAHFVRFDISDGTIICSCKKFEFVGIPCCHVLKVLDFRNIKDLPPRYILKRWSKDAKSGSIRENHDFALEGDPKSSISKRYNALCRILYKIAAKASENIDAFTLMVGQSDQLLEQVERILQTRLLEKPSLSASKGRSPNPVEDQVAQDGNNEAQQVSGKRRKDGVVRRRHQNGAEINRRQKVRKGQSDEAEVAQRELEPAVAPNVIPSQARHPSDQFLAPSHFMQGTYVTAHQFGLGTAQGFHALNQFSQDSSASAIQQQFHGSTHLGQVSQNAVQGYPTPDLHPLQFVGSNPQLDPQSSDQGHCAIPVWDFL